MNAAVLQAKLVGRISLRPAEAAEVTGLSFATIKRVLRSGQLPSKKFGSQIRLIRVDDLIGFIDQLEDA